MLTISVPPQLLDELDDGDDDDNREDHISTRKSTVDMKEDAEKSRKCRRGSSKKGDSLDDSASPVPKYSHGNESVESTTTSNVRLRKSSVASHEASSGTGTGKEFGVNEDKLRARRRCSTRVSTCESKPEAMKVESVSKSSDMKRKSTTRR